MSKKISGSEYPLLKIFSSEFEYHIPSYQRPYAWTEEETSVLFDDLYDFFMTEDDDNYFLGSIVLVKEDDKAYSDVIDGQQRLTTLTILLATIASRFTDKLKDTLYTYICEAGNIFAGLEAKPRLYLREKDNPFFAKYIQELDIENLLKVDLEKLEDEAQRHIVLNCKTVNDKISEKLPNQEDLMKFVMFVLQRCYLIAVSTPSQASAFRVFSVMNSRGLDLLPIDIIKADIIGKIPESSRTAYTEKWENLEVDATRDGFNELFAHIRMIYSKTKAKKSILDEYKEYVWPSIKSQQSFIDDVVEPYCCAFKVIKSSEYKSTENAGEINYQLMWLNRIDNTDWMPAAIKFLAEKDSDSQYVLWFFKKLERLASNLLITAKDINKRIKRYCDILLEMEARPDHSKANPLQSIELTQEEMDTELECLGGNIYEMTSRRRNYIILKLDSIVSDGSASYTYKVLTIEHVLPQTIDPASQWAALWPEENDRKYWTHKIANLVPLSRKKNSAAQNYDFNLKKEKYFKNDDKTSPYALTTQVLNEAVWTPDVVKARQELLIGVFKKYWELK